MIDNVQHIEHLLTEKIAGRRVLVIGDLMLDRYLWGDVDRISPEAPVPVVRLADTTENPGGAANVALNLAGLGVAVTLAGFVGCDQAGETLTALLAGRGVYADTLCRVESIPTVVKSRVIVKRNQMLRLDLEDSAVPPSEARRELAGLVRRQIESGAEAVVISDYAKGAVSTELVSMVVTECGKRDIPVIVDPKGTDFSKYRGATCITPNFKEFCEAAGSPVDDDETLVKLAGKMRKRIGVDMVVVTRGEKGITAVGKNACTVPAISREVFDVSGAGDTVVAMLAVARLAGLNQEESLKLANLAAGVVIGKVGTVAINTAGLVAAVYQADAVQSSAKLIEIDELLEKTDIWRAGGIRVGVVAGGQEQMRAGDIELLETTRSRCGKLIVLLRSPEGKSTEQLGDLSRIVAALHCVDAVAVADNLELTRAISRIKPDELIDGWAAGRSR